MNSVYYWMQVSDVLRVGIIYLFVVSFCFMFFSASLDGNFSKNIGSVKGRAFGWLIVTLGCILLLALIPAPQTIERMYGVQHTEHKGEQQ